jgi:hypothetical protein
MPLLHYSGGTWGPLAQVHIAVHVSRPWTYLVIMSAVSEYTTGMHVFGARGIPTLVL